MTAQVHEKLKYEGKKTSINFCPSLPENDPRIKILDDDEIGKTDSVIFSTACWRQYIGSWEIKDDKFYLVSLKGRLKIVGKSPILADWFSGVIRIPKGEELHYVHMGFGTIYEEEIHVKIEKGIVVKSKTVNNRDKNVDPSKLGWDSMPGLENRFDGDDDF